MMLGRLTICSCLLASIAAGQTANSRLPRDASQRPGPPATPAPKVTYSSIHVAGPYVAMTFDDGPHATLTPKLLDLLARKKIKVTFFVLGENAVQHPEILKRAVAEGHEIGNHSWSHPNLAKLSNDALRSQLQRTDDIIAQATGSHPKLMRPPYGELTPKQRQWVNNEFGYKVILWDVDPLDWKEPGPSIVAGAIAGLVFGKLFDRIGARMLIAAFVLSAFFAPLVFLGKTWIALLGMILWGIGMGAQESLLKSVIAGLIAANKRSTAFGLFDTGFGVAWFAGSWLMGVLYGKSISGPIVFSVVLQLLSLPIFALASRTSTATSERT